MDPTAIDDVTLGHWVDQWLAAQRAAGVHPRTLVRYAHALAAAEEAAAWTDPIWEAFWLWVTTQHGSDCGITTEL